MNASTFIERIEKQKIAAAEFPCRIKGCERVFLSRKARQPHEVNHVLRHDEKRLLHSLRAYYDRHLIRFDRWVPVSETRVDNVRPAGGLRAALERLEKVGLVQLRKVRTVSAGPGRPREEVRLGGFRAWG